MREISYAYGQNHFATDRHLQAMLRRYWTDFEAHTAELEAFGAYAGRELYETVYHVDHDARPILVQHDLDGNRIDRVRLSPAHRDALRAIAKINRMPYEGGSWHHHFALGYLVADPAFTASRPLPVRPSMLSINMPQNSTNGKRQCWQATHLVQLG